MNHKIGRLVFAGSALFSTNSFAADVSGLGCTDGVSTPVVSSATTFINDTIRPKCSNSVTLGFYDSGSRMGVKAASSKGMHTYGGSTTAGGIFQCESSSVATPAAGLSATIDGC